MFQKELKVLNHSRTSFRCVPTQVFILSAFSSLFNRIQNLGRTQLNFYTRNPDEKLKEAIKENSCDDITGDSTFRGEVRKMLKFNFLSVKREREKI